jgi:DNA-binding NarL/FixJ family response regulator
VTANRPIRVLIVDDVAAVVEPFAAVLSAAEDVEIVGTAQDGSEAITLVRELDPDVVLMDIRMPVMDGIKATRAIRRAALGPRILMMTAYDDDSLVREAMDAGADGYLVKGTLVADVLVAIRSANAAA